MSDEEYELRKEEFAELDRIFDVPFTFSQWCRSGLVNYLPNGVCQCRRCREERGEPVTEETNRIAKEQAEVADAQFRESMRASMGT